MTTENNISIVRTLDSRLNVSKKQTYAVLEGTSQVTYQSYQASSFNNSQIIFNTINVPQGLFLSKKINLKMSFDI